MAAALATDNVNLRKPFAGSEGGKEERNWGYEWAGGEVRKIPCLHRLLHLSHGVSTGSRDFEI